MKKHRRYGEVDAIDVPLPEEEKTGLATEIAPSKAALAEIIRKGPLWLHTDIEKPPYPGDSVFNKQEPTRAILAGIIPGEQPVRFLLDIPLKREAEVELLREACRTAPQLVNVSEARDARGFPIAWDANDPSIIRCGKLAFRPA